MPSNCQPNCKPKKVGKHCFKDLRSRLCMWLSRTTFQELSASCHFRLGVNFTKILWAAFSYESLLNSFLFLRLRFVFFWQKEFGAKAARKMLVSFPARILFYHTHTQNENNFRVKSIKHGKSKQFRQSTLTSFISSPGGYPMKEI